MSNKVYEPILPPTVHDADPRANLSDVEQEMYEVVLQYFLDTSYSLPGNEGKGELTEAEKFWLSRECLLRPGLYLFPSRQNTDGPERQIQFTVWMLERTIDLMGPGVETLALLINYGDKAKNPSLSVARTVLNILQDHYPERLGAALILNVPFLLNAFYKLINPFIDPVSRDKMKFNPRVIEDKLFTGDMVMSEWWGGDCDFEYVHDKYWPTLVSICESRRKVWLEKWRTLGGTVGLKEWEYKSGKTISVAANKEKVVDQPEQLDVLSCVDPMAV
ncbi:hypothetical protein C0989_005968 [Termitomyces sp. Mn162]|nr:hypothetical protein C0989_005968 [Termitomyces sp. Mn162]